MQAVVTTRWGHQEMADRPTPEPAAGQALLRVLRAGICGSDLHIFAGHHPTAVQPLVQGHEFVGVIEAIGEGGAPEGLTRGDRVVVEPLVSCGTCEACRAGHVHVCRNLGLVGIHRDGAFAEFVLVDSAKMIRVPESMSDQIAALAEPFAVGFHVNRRAGLVQGESALVIGAGSIGLMVAMVAELSGARVCLADIDPQRIAAARAMGFDTIHAADGATEAGEAFTESDGFDVVFEVSGAEPAIGLATELCRVRGRIVQVGFYSEPPRVDLVRLIFREQTILGSRVYTFEDFRRTVRMLDQIVSRRTFDLDALIAETIDLDTVPAAIQKMMADQVKGKILINPGANKS
jgi:2-desacetyl-2-hydroxyethyl bacteriochlorophyllide A dehydrogenase